MSRLLLFATVLLASFSCGTVQAALIASESFWTTDTEADPQYFDNTRFDTNGNPAVVVGNFGFSAGNTWATETGTILLEDDAPNGGGLTHSLVSGTIQPGAVDYRVSHTRNASRLLAAPAPLSSTYYLSGVVQANQELENANNYFAMGFGNTASLSVTAQDIDNGFHLGMYQDGSDGLRLAAFGGGSIFDLGAADIDTNYMIVLELEADAGGADTLNAWVAEDGDPLTQVLTGQSLETFAGVADVGRFLVQQSNSTINNQENRAWADEMRFGTALADVVSIPTPEPGTGVLGLVGIAMLLAARHRNRN